MPLNYLRCLTAYGKYAKFCLHSTTSKNTSVAKTNTVILGRLGGNRSEPILNSKNVLFILQVLSSKRKLSYPQYVQATLNPRLRVSA